MSYTLRLLIQDDDKVASPLSLPIYLGRAAIQIGAVTSNADAFETHIRFNAESERQKIIISIGSAGPIDSSMDV